MKNTFHILLGCCAVLFCARSVFGQGYDTCAILARWQGKDPLPGDSLLAKEQYDTLRLYIEKCAAGNDESYIAFLHIDGAVQLMSSDTTRYEAYRTWLISVLYLNTTNPAYFCTCLASIAGTYHFGKFAPLGGLAVLDFMHHHHPECWNEAADKQYTEDSSYFRSEGYDPTHLPSLDSMGLGFLLKSGVAAPSASLTSSYIASFTSSPNPFIKETTLEFTLNRGAYVTLAIYDELGLLVWGDGKGSALEAGMHVIHLDGNSFPSGTLYARIATGFGEVKTVKLIHEK